MNTRLILLSSLIILLGRCNNSSTSQEIKNSSDNYSVMLEPLSEQLSFDIDDSTSFDSNYFFQTDIDGEEVLMTQNLYKNSIQIWSIEKQKLINEIRFNHLGPNGINVIHGFTVLNKDSILIYNKFMPTALISDFKGQILGRIDLSEKRGINFNHASMNRLPDIKIRNKIYFYLFPPMELSWPDFYSPSNKFEWVYNIKGGSSGYADVSWPSFYKDKYWGIRYTLPSRVKGSGDFLVYSFGADHNLHIVDEDGAERIVEARSDFFNDDINSLNPGDNEERLFLERDIYWLIIYDKYRNVYYRIAGQKTNPDLEDGKQKSPYDKPYSVIILDKDFKKIGETPLVPVRSYLLKDFFVSSKGLCISYAHPLNEKLDEDKMKFNVLILREK